MHRYYLFHVCCIFCGAIKKKIVQRRQKYILWSDAVELLSTHDHINVRTHVEFIFTCRVSSDGGN